VIFASYWQGFFLSILLFFNALPSTGKYTADNIALAIQDALICFEMPLFAVAHWYAFSHADFRDYSISTARLPVFYAVRDAFGFIDLWIDLVDAFQGRGYEYRLFEPLENERMHPSGAPRLARIAEGLRYERGGEGKYWLPVPIDESRGLLASGHRTYLSTAERDREWWPNEEPLVTEITPEDERLFDDARALEFGDYNVLLLIMDLMIVSRDSR
jgi:Organic solute transporter Ostalpha